MNKKYKIKGADSARLVQLACMHKRLQTYIDEANKRMNVYTNFADNKEPTSVAAIFELIIDE
jgi:hypothetical protein